MTVRYTSELIHAIGGVPAGYSVVDYDAEMRVFTLARQWYAPFAILWRMWSKASIQEVARLPKGRLA